MTSGGGGTLLGADRRGERVGQGAASRARCISSSPRRERRFCDVNCAALPDDLLESELFGHTRGAFTGAVADRAGLVEEADGGTLFLDEVADLSPRAQAKLLRVLQQQEVRRVGETVQPQGRRPRRQRRQSRHADARSPKAGSARTCSIASTSCASACRRCANVPRTFRCWPSTSGGRRPRASGSQAPLTHGVLTALARYHWPGNVRELQNVMAGARRRGAGTRTGQAGVCCRRSSRVRPCHRRRAWPMRAISSSAGSSSWRWHARADVVRARRASLACRARDC